MERPVSNNLPLVDSHLDLAENVTLFGRDLTLSAVEIRTLEKRTTRQATVSLPELERGGIASDRPYRKPHNGPGVVGLKII